MIRFSLGTSALLTLLLVGWLYPLKPTAVGILFILSLTVVSALTALIRILIQYRHSKEDRKLT